MKGTPAVERRRRTARKQRALQEQTEELDAHSEETTHGAMQAGARRYPEPPMPKQHQVKPGQQTQLDPPPTAFQLHATRFEDLTDEHFNQTLKTNLYGYFNMTRAAMPHLTGGVILNTGSVTGINGSKHLLDYSMTKGGIHAFTRSLAGLLMPRGIRVNAVAPGPVWTPFNPADADADHVAHFGESACMKRPAQPEEIAPAYVFLASSHCSSYITGEILPVIGGY